MTIFLQDIRPVEAVGCAGFLELVQHTMDSRQQTLYNVHILCLFNKTIRMYYSLYVFSFYFKIIGLSYPSLVRWYGPGLGLKLAARAGPGSNINGLGRAFAGPGPKF